MEGTKINRSTKPDVDWTKSELLACNVVVEDADLDSFFGIPQLLPSTASLVIFNHLELPNGPTTNDERLFFDYLGDALSEDASGVVDFTAFLLRMFDFDSEGRCIRSRIGFSFEMCSSVVYSKPPLCVMRASTPLLFVQTDKVGSGIPS